MARKIRIRRLMFHNVQCLLETLPKLMTEIGALSKEDDVSFETVTEVADPAITDSTEDDKYGTISFPLLRCSNPACNVKQRAETSKKGWLQLRLFE